MDLILERILVTGANGFLGSNLCKVLKKQQLNITAVMRNADLSIMADDYFLVGDINSSTDWSSVLINVDVVFHIAARVHLMLDAASDPLTEFRCVNTAGTEHLARSAAANGVRRLVYVSSIKVNGEETFCSRSYSEQNVPAPLDPYGVSKWEAEQALHRVANETGLEVVIIRSPLVYGAGVKANFLSLLNAVNKSLPLPVGSIDNRRRMIYVGNLVDALITCARHPAAAGQTYLVSDAESVSTPNLIRNLAKVLGRRCFVFSFPIFILRFLAKLLGKSKAVDRLTQSLEIDSSKIYNELSWKPPYTMQQGLQATADWYLQSIKNKT